MRRCGARIEQCGRLFLWKYKTDGWLGSEWHFSADSPGRRYFLNLLDGLEQSTREERRLLSLDPVTRSLARRPGLDLPTENRFGLRLRWQPSDGMFNVWHISDNQKIVDVEFGQRILVEWRRMVALPGRTGNDRILGLDEDHVIFIW